MRKHGADGEEKLGQAQFAQLLQSVMQDLEEELSKENVVVIRNIQVVNGSKLRKVSLIYYFKIPCFNYFFFFIYVYILHRAIYIFQIEG